ncbi:hypothetical protein CRUP_003018 [Coryphaenoides rupestris]|nr:hypothetical protein CRUP_003018 [Coryphaenoides rupestris]
MSEPGAPKSGTKRFISGVVEEQLKALISAAKQHDVDFIYAISPGLDITFSNPKEVSALKMKLDQAFSSFAHAQVAITNQVYQHLGEPQTFLFCPTDYCAAFCTPSVSGSAYLHTDPDHSYSPQKALRLALTDWLQEFLNTDQPGGPRGLKKGSLDEEPMQTDVGTGPYVPGLGENPLYTAEPLTLEDLNLLSELFYLPYEYGPTAKTMLQELDWLKNNSGAAVADTEQSAEWHSRAGRFDQMCEAVVQMFNRLSNAPNRRILYDLYNYICDIKSAVGLARAHVMTDEPEPWGFRGGLSGELQRMLPCHGNRDLFRHPLMTVVYTVRPYCPGDECAFVLEDEMGLCGYALGLTDVAATKIQGALWDSILGVYPSLITMQVLPRVTDPAPVKRMISCLLSTIKSAGSRGVFCELRPTDRRMLDFYTQLGSFQTIPLAGGPPGVITMGTSL